MKKLFSGIKKHRKKIVYTLLLLLVIIQFIRPERNSGSAYGAGDITHFTAVPQNVRTVLEKSCYDCHSDHTEYPWYTNIQPVGWWMQDHVNEGKREVNFSEFSAARIRRAIRKFHEIGEQVEEDEMPLNSYLWIHRDAKLDEAQKKIILDWAKRNEDSLKALYPDSVIRR